LVDTDHAGLGAGEQQAIAGYGVAQRAQPVAVHASDHPIAAERADPGRPVPRLHHGVAVAVEIAVRLGHGLAFGPRIGNQQALDHRQGAADADHRFEHVVEHRRIGAAGLDDRLDVGHVVAIDGGRHARLMRLHPVDVALQRVDLAVVSDDAERLRQMPGRKRVRRVALVIDGEVGDEAFVEQIGIERGQLLGQEHALVDHRPAGHGADVELLNRLLHRRLLDAPADDIEIDLELFFGRAEAVGDHDLLDLGPGRVRLLADDLDVHRYLAPAVDRVAVGQDLALDDDAAALLGAQVGAWQKDLADAELPLAGHLPLATDVLLEEILRNLHVDAGAVAGLAVGIDGAAMPHGLQRGNAGLDDLPARLAVDGGDQPDAAGIMLLRPVIESVGC